MDFKESPTMYAIALGVVVFIIAQPLFFVIKSWKHGKEIGISKETMKNTIISSIMFTVAPAISILVTVIVLANALGIVLPWIRLSVLGNLAYETVAAQTAVEAMGGSLATPVTDTQQFSTIAWAMTIGATFPLFFLPLVCKKLQNKIGDTVNKNENTKKLGDSISAAAFIGIISAFIARAIDGTEKGKAPKDPANAGIMSVSVLIVSIVSMLILSKLCAKFKLEKLEPFTMPISMFIGMGSAMLISAVCPANIANFVWR